MQISTELPPLQHRTPEQLRDGLTVTVKGAGSNDLAVARLNANGSHDSHLAVR